MICRSDIKIMRLSHYDSYVCDYPNACTTVHFVDVMNSIGLLYKRETTCSAIVGFLCSSNAVYCQHFVVPVYCPIEFIR